MMEPPHSIRARAAGAIPRGAAIWVWIAALALAATAAPAWAGGTIYAFVDPQGVTHFTNRPQHDARFKPIRLRDQLAAPRKYREPQVHVYDPLIGDAAASEGVPPALVKAVIAAESAFDSDAVSHRGAQGLMQLMPETAQEMYVKDIFDVRDNIEGGTRYLRVLANEFQGDMVKMVAAYNAGPDAVRKYGGNIPPFEETQAYVRKVLQLYFQYKDLANLARADRP